MQFYFTENSETFSEALKSSAFKRGFFNGMRVNITTLLCQDNWYHTIIIIVIFH